MATIKFSMDVEKPLKPNNQITRTFILIKPDAIERKLMGEIIRRFENKGYKIVASELRWITKSFAEQHYEEHKGNMGYFKAMCEAISAGPAFAMVLEGKMAVEGTRQLIGQQNPIGGSSVGTIRGDFGIEAPFNLVHGSDGPHSAAREITLWFNASLIHPQNEPTKMKYVGVPKPTAGSVLNFGPPKKKIMPMPTAPFFVNQLNEPISMEESLAAKDVMVNEVIQKGFSPDWTQIGAPIWHDENGEATPFVSIQEIKKQMAKEGKTFSWSEFLSANPTIVLQDDLKQPDKILESVNPAAEIFLEDEEFDYDPFA